MEVRFRRTAPRRYTVAVSRPGLPPVEFQGPGYDPAMPHDLAHLIVEMELGLRHGIFGFYAAGGDAGGAAHLSAGEDPRQARRRRAKAARRDERLRARGGRDDGAASERAQYLCWYEWLRRSEDPARRVQAEAMAANARPIRSNLPDGERKMLTEERLRRVCARMDELGARWARLEVGESFSVAWTGHPTLRRATRRTSEGRYR